MVEIRVYQHDVRLKNTMWIQVSDQALMFKRYQQIFEEGNEYIKNF